MRHNYEVFGEGPVGIVVELGLGSCLSEWIPMANLLQKEYSVLLYERAGINKSEPSEHTRTPYNIANELFALLSEIDHMDKIVFIAHSQGGLYAQQFCRLYPNLVKGVILLDPLTAKDNEFRNVLSKQEYKKSGVDKSLYFKLMRLLAKLKLGGITKALSRKAPPFYYYEDFSDQQIEDILNSVTSVQHASTILQEYYESHEIDNVKTLQDKGNFPDIPLILITHSSELAVEESMKFGGTSKEFAEKVERIWQDLMKEYLDYSEKSVWIRAEKSTHYIHLQQPELIMQSLKEVLKDDQRTN